jgi:hypothetical protein
VPHASTQYADLLAEGEVLKDQPLSVEEHGAQHAAQDAEGVHDGRS